MVRLGRQESWWTPGKRSIICSAHFNVTDFFFTKCGLKRLCKGSVPQNALFLTSTPYDNISINSAVGAEPSTPVIEENITATGTTITPPLDFSDIDSIFDTPRKKSLKKKLRNKTVLQFKHARIIKSLREKTRRLKKANCSLRNIIKSLKQERFIDNDLCNILSKNVFAADLFNNIYKKQKKEKKIVPKYTIELKKFCLTKFLFSICIQLREE